MWGVLIFVDINPMAYMISCCGSLGSSKDLLFKSILGSCAMPHSGPDSSKTSGNLKLNVIVMDMGFNDSNYGS